MRFVFNINTRPTRKILAALLSVMFLEISIFVGIILVNSRQNFKGKADAIGAQYYVAPNGSSSGNGSIENPWDLQTALNQPALVHPGDTIWLRGGTYTGNFISNLTGTAAAPITVKQYPGEKAILKVDSGQFVLRISAPWSTYEGLEIMSNNTDRTIVRPDGVQIYYQNNKFINLVVHDANNGFVVSSGANNTEIYGSVVFNNGYQGEVMGKGHGLLLKTRINDNNENRFYRDNIIFNQYGWGPLAYAWGEGMEGHYFEGNTIFNNNILAGDSSANCLAGKCIQNFSIGGGQISKRITLKNNYIYGGTDGMQRGLTLNFGWWQESNGKGGTGLTMENNVVWCNADCYDILLWKWDDVTLKNNLFAKDVAFQEINGLGNFAFHQLDVANFSVSNFNSPERLEQLQPNKFSGNRFHLQANEPNKIFVRPNLYEPGRANVTIYNWENRSQINLDLSSVLQSGDQFEIIDVQNYSGNSPLITGTYNGQSVSLTLPDSSSPVTAPIGGTAPLHTSRKFAALLVRRTQAGDNPPSSPTPSPTATPTPTPTATPTITPSPSPTAEIFSKKVFLLIFNPIIESSHNQRLNTLLGWNNPDNLTSSYISDITESSHGIANYQINQRMEVDDFPILNDGYDYNDASYLECWYDHTKCHEPSGVNYQAILSTYQICEKLNSGQIDELWLFGGPWFGYWEAVMTGPDSFFTNGPVITGTSCNKKMHIMGFNYEREVSEMLEDFGHRIEGTMTHVYGGWNQQGNSDWDKFTRTDILNPGNSVCGNVHYAPNSERDYDWTNQRMVASNCDGWLTFPNVTDSAEQINCSEWNCDPRQHKKWWLKHIPHGLGKLNEKYNDWWKYILDIGSTTNFKAGDVNGDRLVNIVDIGIIIDNYGSSPPTDQRADLNHDNIVNIVDIGIVIDHYGT